MLTTPIFETRKVKSQTLSGRVIVLFTSILLTIAFYSTIPAANGQSLRHAASSCQCNSPGYGCGIDETGGCYFNCANYCCQKFPRKCSRMGTGTQYITANEVEINPNPVSNSAIIFFPIFQAQNVSIKIFDLNGRLVSILTENYFEEGEHELVWNATALNAGIYFLQFQSDGLLQTEKVVVTR